MKSLELHGLSTQQKLLCDLLWSCETMEDVNSLIANLPQGAKQDARLVFELLVAAEYDTVDEVEPAVLDIINHYR
jgi:hypothetical protein